MKQLKLNKKKAIADWQVCLFAAVVGLVITVMAFCLTHLSFLLTWMVVTLGSIPLWAQVMERAKERFPHYGNSFEVLFDYLIMGDYDENDEEDCDNLSIDD